MQPVGELTTTGCSLLVNARPLHDIFNFNGFVE
jgi:hypothetical protein